MPGEDLAAIVNTVNLYPIAVDSQQWDLFGQVFTTDVHADFGGQAVWDGLAPLVQAFAMIHEPFTATQHATRGHHVAVEGDRATCLSYVHGRFIRPVPAGGDMFESSGWYDDALVRTPAGWRIASRTCRMIWWGGNPAVLAAAPGANVEHVLDSLCAEGRAGRVGHLRAISGRTG
jgi:hypothetical protein